MWLLERNILEAMQRAIAAGMHPTVEQQIDFEARSFGAEGNDGPRLLAVVGNNAEIAISGVITKKPDFLAMLFGGGNTTYADINAAVASAEQDDAVDNITLMIDSPGGQVDGLFDTLAILEAAKKPIKALASKATSAAFAIGAQADEFIASNRASEFGSIGVAAGIRVNDSIIEIASTEAPNKRPDVQTEAGKAVVREYLDSIHQLFAESIATGLGTTVEKVNAEFGQGATLLADDAVKRGMIDGIAGSPLKVVKTTPAAASGTKEVKSMDLKELKAQHHDVYAAAVQEGIDQGIAKERDRVSAHLVMGEASGDLATAQTAIKDGSEMTVTLQSTYMAAGMNKGAVETRTAEEIAADLALEGAAGSTEEQDATASDNLLGAAAEACGVDLKEVV